MIGNVLFFKRTTSIISRVIANITNGEYTHVGLIVAYDEMTGIATIIESDRFVSTRLTRVQLNENHAIFATEMTEEQRNLVIKFAFKSLGEKYDYLQVFGLFLSLLFKKERYAFFNSSNKLICSELIDLSYYKAGVPRKNQNNIGNITPVELFEVYELHDVRKGL
ncbi:hypothetical protein AB3N02_22575 [Priestia aryabhattai]|uniref:hypothetical protein n=1 Tax=Priestia aryabhattai TaxID=412384 RepID=UPI0039A38C16